MDHKISVKGILSIYIIVFISLFVVFLDIFFFEKYLLSILPYSPYQLFIFTLIFEFPHIVASLFSYADKEYLKFYRRKLITRLPLILGSFLLIGIFSFELMMILYWLYTFKHVSSQQTGIGSALMKIRPKVLEIWNWTIILLSWIFIVDTLFNIEGTLNIPTLLFDSFIVILIIAFILSSIYLIVKSKTNVGKLYASLVMLMLISSIIFYLVNYIFFVLLVARVIHDLTAFLFYITHDRNRFKEKPNNIIYKYALKTRIPIFIILPLLAIFLAYYSITFTILVMAISITHYYLDSISWKRGSLHRKYVSYE